MLAKLFEDEKTYIMGSFRKLAISFLARTRTLCPHYPQQALPRREKRKIHRTVIFIC